MKRIRAIPLPTPVWQKGRFPVSDAKILAKFRAESCWALKKKQPTEASLLGPYGLTGHPISPKIAGSRTPKSYFRFDGSAAGFFLTLRGVEGLAEDLSGVVGCFSALGRTAFDEADGENACATGQGLFIAHAAESKYGGFGADGEFIDSDRAQRWLGIFGKLHVVKTHQFDTAVGTGQYRSPRDFLKRRAIEWLRCHGPFA